jgi:renalase
MRVAIVGGGVSGLACGRRLFRLGHEVIVFERSKEVGGRCATHRIGDYLFDTGATSIAPRGKAIEAAMLTELDTSDLVRVERPIYVHKSLRVEPGDPLHNMPDRFTYRSGNQKLAHLLGEGLDVRFENVVERYSVKDGLFHLHIATPTGLAEENSFDALVIAIPAPEAQAIVMGSGDSRPIDFVRYRPCLSLMMGFAAIPEHTPYHALVEPEQTHPLTWLSLESVKSPDRAPAGCTAMVAQLSPAYSRLHYGSADQIILSATLDHLVRLYGSGLAKPEVWDIKRWRYSLPENIAMFGSANPRGSKMVLAGDGLLGGRVEYAYETGVMAADHLLEKT